MTHFSVTTNKLTGYNYFVCTTGSEPDGKKYTVVVDYHPTLSAKQDAALIAKLLNWYYADPTTAESVMAGQVREL